MDINNIKGELRKAYRDLSERGLLHGSKWLAELLASIKYVKDDKPTKTEPIEYDVESEDVYSYAKSLFDLKEFSRAAYHLSKISKPNSKILFLKLYSMWLAGEKRREQESAENNGTKRDNKELDAIFSEVSKHKSDPFLQYLMGVILKSIQRNSDAISCFVNSINIYPLLWSSWMELTHLCTDKEVFDDVLGQIKIKHWITTLFIAKTKKDLQLNEEALELYKDCHSIFPGSSWLSNEIALTMYNLSEFEESEKIFESVRGRDPYCLDHMDSYSNILFVKDQKSKLSVLAHESQSIDKYRAETCLIIGNYYSKCGNHVKSITYFKRAIKIDPMCVSAWTLMGHEFIEVKNTQEAINSYRKAVEISPKDYRAWYGLGQTYELLQLNLHALFYFQKAVALRPYDGRLWCALANCYEGIGRLKDALRCYERARRNRDPDGIALYKTGDLYRQMDQVGKAAEMFELLISEKGPEDDYEMTEINALIFLAQYFRDNGDFTKAEYYCNILLGLDVPEREQAKALLKEIRNLNTYKTTFNASKLPF